MTDAGSPAPAGSAVDRLTEHLSRPGAGLLLDLDGTLVDSEPVHRAAFAAYFADRGWDVPDDVVRQFMGRRGVEAFAALDGPWRGEDPDALTDAVVERLRAGARRPEPVPGARDLLDACAALDLPAVVVTSARREWALGAVELVTGGTGRGITALVTAEDCTCGKPDPEPYRRGADLLGADPARLLAAEDAVAGVVSARAAGVGLVIGMTTSVPAAALTADLALADLRPLAQAVSRVARAQDRAGPGDEG